MIVFYIFLAIVGLALALGAFMLWAASDFDDLERIAKRQDRRPSAKSAVPADSARSPVRVPTDT